jgi:hypothetical protein
LEIWHDLSMSTPKKSKRLLDAYRFAGFRPVATLRGVFGDPHARVVRLVRRSKNGLQGVWWRAVGLVRPQAAAGTRSVLLHISVHRGRRFRLIVDGVSDERGRHFRLIVDAVSV